MLHSHSEPHHTSMLLVSRGGSIHWHAAAEHQFCGFLIPCATPEVKWIKTWSVVNNLQLDNLGRDV